MFWYFEELLYWYREALRRYVDFNGRDSRKAYWMLILSNSLIYLIVFYSEHLMGIGVPLLGTMHPVSRIYAVLTVVPLFAAKVRRLHDTGRSGWWVMLTLVPGAVVLAGYFKLMPLMVGALLGFLLYLLGAVVLTVFLTRGSQRGKNRYGPQPKAY